MMSSKKVYSNKPARITSGYLLFTKEYRRRVIAEKPNIGFQRFGDVSKIVGKLWRELSEKEKTIWKDKANELAASNELARIATAKANDAAASKELARITAAKAETIKVENNGIDLQPFNPTVACSNDNTTDTNEAMVELAVDQANDTNCNPALVCAVGSRIRNITTYWCNFCNFRSDKTDDFLKHINKHRFHCKYCKFKSFFRASVVYHSMQEHEENFHETASNLTYCTYLPDVLQTEDHQGKRKLNESIDTPSKKTCTDFDNYEQIVIKVEPVDDEQIMDNSPSNSSTNIEPELSTDANDLLAPSQILPEPANSQASSPNRIKVEVVNNEQNYNSPANSSTKFQPEQTTDANDLPGQVQILPEPANSPACSPNISASPPDEIAVDPTVHLPMITNVVSGEQAVTAATNPELPPARGSSDDMSKTTSSVCWKCELCDYVTLSQAFLKDHLNSQHPGKMHKYVAMPVSSAEEMKQIKVSDSISLLIDMNGYLQNVNTGAILVSNVIANPTSSVVGPSSKLPAQLPLQQQPTMSFSIVTASSEMSVIDSQVEIDNGASEQASKERVEAEGEKVLLQQKNLVPETKVNMAASTRSITPTTSTASQKCKKLPNRNENTHDDSSYDPILESDTECASDLFEDPISVIISDSESDGDNEYTGIVGESEKEKVVTARGLPARNSARRAEKLFQTTVTTYKCLHCFEIYSSANLIRKHLRDEHFSQLLQGVEMIRKGKKLAYPHYHKCYAKFKFNDTATIATDHADQTKNSNEIETLDTVVERNRQLTSISTEEIYECLYCQTTKLFHSRLDMKKHLILNHAADDYIYRDCIARKLGHPSRFYMCHELTCDFRSDKLYDYCLHLLGHKKAKIYECPSCEWFTSNKEDVGSHMSEKHKEDNTISVFEIGLDLDSQGNLVKHIGGTVIKCEQQLLE